jgi:tRNA pseudouridine38-40 synthase
LQNAALRCILPFFNLMPQKFKFIISYDGTNYGGWQTQSNAISIQALVQKALQTVLRTFTPVIGSGRTDAGVHALGQTAHFTVIENNIDLSRLRFSLNALLPHDVRIRNIEEAAENFHARYSASGKTYYYHLHLDRTINPFKRLYSTHVLHRVDLDLLHQAARLFIGTHDFTSFAHEASAGSASRNAVRTLTRLDLVEEHGGIRLEFEGNGFLYKMVRNIVGTLLDVSRNHISLDAIEAIFKAKDRKKAGRTAPPEGLFLMQVHYPESLQMK